MKNNFLEIKSVDFTIGGKTKVKNASFVIENEGETLCILGPSGIGKTTILRTIAGLEEIEKGSIKLNGKLISSKDKQVEKESSFKEEMGCRLHWVGWQGKIEKRCFEINYLANKVK